MDWLSAIILGIIQGLSEFLPVSSSGHLELGRSLLGIEVSGSSGMLFTVTVHAATALATVVVFYKEIVSIIQGLFQGREEDRRFAGAIIVSMLPAAFVGLLFEDAIEGLFEGSTLLVGAMLVITGLLLLMADRAKKTHKKVSVSDAFAVGIAQAIAILPGISRSGATISTSVLLGIDREHAARFSFLMVVPLIMGKMILDMADLASNQESAQDPMLPLVLGFYAAFITGLWACRTMIQLVKRAKLRYFAYYCFAVGTVASLWTVLA
ncbi:MAG: undecaprenyl-diphosphate phosphatase [Schleiferiaceae bacterium]